ncbi:MAG: MMPL family transporter [Actinomycetota bacterium]|nr:MMPL family transporter [Actinomycetota bacterium]
MFDALGGFAYRRRRLVLIGASLFLAFASIWGTGVFGVLSGGGFEDPKSDSFRGAQLLYQRFGRDGGDVIVLYTSRDKTVDDAAVSGGITDALGGLPSDKVSSVASFYTTHAASFVSPDRHSTYAVIGLRGSTDDARRTQLEAIRTDLQVPGLTAWFGGSTAINADINGQVGKDIGKAEGLSTPIVLILMLFIFGSLAAASLPLAIGGLAILGAFTMLRVLTLFTDVSVFSVNIVTLLGLGLAIDYALFMVSRFREELPKADGDVEAALRATMTTAGRTVAFSGLTVGISLGSLLIFPQVFLRSMGFGGMAAVLVAMVGALTVLPALLAVLGHRVNSLSVRPFLRRVTRRPATKLVADDEGGWTRIARSVMKRPAVYAVVIVIGLLALGTPFTHIKWGGIDERALPASTESRVVAEVLKSDFASNGTTPESVAVVFDNAVDQAALTAYAASVAQVPGVRTATISGVRDHVGRVTVRYDATALSAEARHTTDLVRAVPAPAGAEALVTGQNANLVDLLASLGSRLPWMALIVCLVTLVLLFLAFGSVVLPVKALIMNILSLSATFGALVWIFQYGHLAKWLGFTPTGTIEATQPILVLAIAFGLSMDYEVFLLSRIKEHWDATCDNVAAVTTGLQRSGTIITSAALLLVIVIGAFSTSGITFIKLIGVGMIVAIIVDATVVRALLVPATMRLMGRANWWAPSPLRRVYARYGIREA